MLRRKVFAIVLFAIVLLLASVKATAQTYTDLHDFNCQIEGCYPVDAGILAQGRDGNLYGTTWGGQGGLNYGTVFKATPSGEVTTIYSFSGSDGTGPAGGLTLGSDGDFYGTTTNGGTIGYGTIFKITAAGVLTILHSFGSSDAYPYSPPVQGKNGAFYGVTSSGTAYSITSSGTYKLLSTSIPYYSYSPLLLASDGNFYGTSWQGGATYNGSVYRMSATGAVKVIHNFGGDGVAPIGGLVQGSDGLLYGTTTKGGSKYSGIVFKITTAGKLTVLHEFDCGSTTDGCAPYPGLVLGTDGNFYGATSQGNTDGSALYGTLFKITKTGAYTRVYTFDQTHGADQLATATQHTNGIIYGLTDEGGAYQTGVFYSLALGLKPFVFLLTNSGAAGQTVQILGTGLTGATSVKFGSGSATFSVISDTYVTAVVPANGTTGNVTVTAPAGTYISSKQFKVVPVVSSFLPTSGPVGTQVVITGSGFLGATKVTFGGVKATVFSVDSATQITATVPIGAKTGSVAVTTPGGTGSKAKFTVTP